MFLWNKTLLHRTVLCKKSAIHFYSIAVGICKWIMGWRFKTFMLQTVEMKYWQLRWCMVFLGRVSLTFPARKKVKLIRGEGRGSKFGERCICSLSRTLYYESIILHQIKYILLASWRDNMFTYINLYFKKKKLQWTSWRPIWIRIDLV